MKRSKSAIIFSIACVVIAGYSTFHYRNEIAKLWFPKANVMSADDITRNCLLALHEHATEYARLNHGVFPTLDQLCDSAVYLNPLYKDRRLPVDEGSRCCHQLLHNLRITYYPTKSKYRPGVFSVLLFSSVVVSTTKPNYELLIDSERDITERVELTRKLGSTWLPNR